MSFAPTSSHSRSSRFSISSGILQSLFLRISSDRSDVSSHSAAENSSKLFDESDSERSDASSATESGSVRSYSGDTRTAASRDHNGATYSVFVESEFLEVYELPNLLRNAVLHDMDELRIVNV